MKNIQFAALTGMLVLTIGCGNDDHQTAVNPTDSALNQIIPDTPSTVVMASTDTIFAENEDTTVVLANGEAFIKGHIRANKRQPVYSVKGSKGQTFIATIKPIEKGGNVRINQIQLPDKSFDGPFGDSLQYTLKKSGILRFIIGQNMMAGDPWSGDFVFHIKTQ